MRLAWHNIRVDKPRPTQKDIARFARVTQATVSLALSNHPRLSAEVRDRVQAIARQLGYEPDPYLSGLAAHKKQRRKPQFQATLAWVTNWPVGGREWRKIPTFLLYYEGAARRAAELGYKLEEHDLARRGMTPQRFEQVLKAKNIPGLLLAPQPFSQTRLDLRLDRFSCVSFGYSLASPRLHLVTTHHFRAMETLFQQLIARGYRRPGLVVETDNELRVDRIPSAAFLSKQEDLPKARRVPVLTQSKLTPERFLAWYRRHRPDVIVSLWELMYPWLTDAGIRVPDDVSVVGFDDIPVAAHMSPTLTSVHQDFPEVGRRAVRILLAQIRGEELPVFGALQPELRPRESSAAR